MKKYFGPVVCLMAGFLFFPNAADAAPASAEYRGKILLDVSGHGEAWYVDPQTQTRTFLGRPEEAVERLRSRAVLVNYENVARIGTTVAEATDDEYAGQMAGHVLTPNDLIGASWYVDPTTKLRRRLANGADAWEIMKQGMPVSAKTLAAIDKDTPVSMTTEAKVAEVVTADTLRLDTGKMVRLISVDVPSNPELQAAAKARLSDLIKTSMVTLESDSQTSDGSGDLLRFVHVGGVNLSHDLVRNGLAFHDITPPNLKYGELLIVGSIDAQRNKKGFWNR